MDVSERRENRAAAAIVVAAAAVFVVLRVALIFARDPDIDEIFTTWIATKDFSSMMRTLALDSGPPLYYLIVRALHAGSATGVRFLSLGAAAITFALVVMRGGSSAQCAAAAALIAVYPQHVFFSAEARTYALCALGVAVAIFALETWTSTGSRGALAVAAAAILATAWCHYYGVLFFALPLVMALLFRRRDWFAAAIATVIIAAAFVPGFMLAARQRGQGVSWMEIPGTFERVTLVAGSFGRIGFDARHQYSSGSLTALASLASVAILLIALWRTRRDARARFFFVALVLPIVEAMVIAAAGVTAYFPIRFESLLSAAAVMWIVASVAGAPQSLRATVFGVAFFIGLMASIDIVRAPRTQQSPERAVAREVRAHLSPRIPIVASHLAFLEIFGERDASWNPLLIGYPREYEVHPGARPDRAAAIRDLPRISGVPRPFLWIGESSSPEAEVLAGAFTTRVVARAGSEAAVLVYNPRPVLSQPALMR